MELVYLWVEEYKNIHKQGFNFSPRFKCHYDENINELTIDENKDYVSIFPENINVTAIVGENGSGKSSVLEFLLELFSEEFGRESRNRCLLLYLYKNIPRYYSYKVSSLNMNELTINSLKIEEQSYLLLDMHYGHENLISLCINNEYSEVGSFKSSQFFIENSKKKSKEINILIIENSLKLKNILTKIENYFIPTKINIKIKELEYLTSILYKDMEFYNYDARNRIGSLIEESKNTTLISKIDLI
jgi:energy-coupling factor transporter ATP-binding protein EcfA2